MKLALIGYGNVGRAFGRLIERKRASFPFRIVGVHTARHGTAIDPRGLAAEPAFGPAAASAGEFLDRAGAEVMIEVTPLNPATGEPAIGHNDWRVEHLRFAGGELAAAWDWDSLGSGPEPAFVGSSAHCFTADYRVDDLDVVPTLKEALAFLDDYEAARGAPFSSAERRAAIAALIAMMAYAARCEHADVLTDWSSAPARPAPRCVPADSYRGFLAMHGPELLGVEVSGVPAVCEA